MSTGSTSGRTEGWAPDLISCAATSRQCPGPHSGYIPRCNSGTDLWQWLSPSPALGSQADWQWHSLAGAAAAVLHQLHFLPCFAHFSTGSTCPSHQAPRGLADSHGKHTPQMESFLGEDGAKVPGTLVLGLELTLHALFFPLHKVFIFWNPLRTVSLTPCFWFYTEAAFWRYSAA